MRWEDIATYWNTSFVDSVRQFGHRIAQRHEDLLPNLTEAERSAIRRAVFRHYHDHPEDFSSSVLMSREAYTAAGLREGDDIDERLLFLYTACAYASVSLVSIRKGDVPEAMHHLASANYLFGFQDSGDLRKFVSEAAQRRLLRADMGRAAAKKKLEDRAPIRARALKLVEAGAKWKTRERCYLKVGQQLWSESPGDFQSEDAAIRMVKDEVLALSTAADRFFERLSNRKRKM